MSTEEPQLPEWKAGAGYRVGSILVGIVGFCFLAAYAAPSSRMPNGLNMGASLLGTSIVLWWMGSIVLLLTEIRDRRPPPPIAPREAGSAKVAAPDDGVYKL